MYSVTSGSTHTLFYAYSICNCTVRANIPKSIYANYFGTSTLISVYLYTNMHICCFIFTTAAIYYSSNLLQQRFTTAAIYYSSRVSDKDEQSINISTARNVTYMP